MSRHKQSNPSIIKSSVIRLRVTEAEANPFKIKTAEAGCAGEHHRRLPVSAQSGRSLDVGWFPQQAPPDSCVSP